MIQVSGLSLADPLVKYLGVFPLRTALDVLQPGLAYRFPFQLTGYGYPWAGWSGYPGYLPHLAFIPANTGVEVEVTPVAQVVTPPAPVEAVDVAEEVVPIFSLGEPKHIFKVRWP